MGYGERFTGLDMLEGVGKDEKEFYLQDASGYVSEYGYLAVKLPEDKLCERCGRPACHVTHIVYPYDWSQPHHLLCLRCRDDWKDYTNSPDHRINRRMTNWEKLFTEFITVKVTE